MRTDVGSQTLINMSIRSREQWRDELIEKLEAMHMLVVEADAFRSAFDAIYSTMTWPSERDPGRRRAMNRMGCFLDQLNAKLDDLLRGSQDVVRLAMKRVS